MKTVQYIIGDIHGQAALLSSLLDAIQSRHQWKHQDKAAKLVYLGDYIDRGPASKQVIDRVLRGIEGFSQIFLKGNHEQLMSACLLSEDRDAWNMWMSAGGEPTLESFGYDLFLERYNSKKLAEVLGQSALMWLEQLKPFYRYEDFVCVHAGLAPEVELKHQKEKDLL